MIISRLVCKTCVFILTFCLVKHGPKAINYPSILLNQIRNIKKKDIFLDIIQEIVLDFSISQVDLEESHAAKMMYRTALVNLSPSVGDVRKNTTTAASNATIPKSTTPKSTTTTTTTTTTTRSPSGTLTGKKRATRSNTTINIPPKKSTEANKKQKKEVQYDSSSSDSDHSDEEYSSD